jgi:hypothetical protein
MTSEGMTRLKASRERALRGFTYGELRRNYYPRPASMGDMNDEEADRLLGDVDRELGGPESRKRWEAKYNHHLRLAVARIIDRHKASEAAQRGR